MRSIELRERVWNWLPTFLAVANEGGIKAAAARLHVTPAAVSRTIRLLEAEFGKPLFNRVGRTLALNDRGARLQASLWEATAAVDRGVARSLSSAFAGQLRVASVGVLTDHFVISELLNLKARYEELIPEHRNMLAKEATAEIAAGGLDVAFYYEELSVEGVEVEKIAETGASIYCGRGHALFEVDAPKRATILECAFSVPEVGGQGRVLDGWPPELPRKIGMRITTLRSNHQVCRSGLMLCVLPDRTAFDDCKLGILRRLGDPGLPKIPVYAARAVGGLRGGAGDMLIERTRSNIEAFNQEFTAFVEAG